MALRPLVIELSAGLASRVTPDWIALDRIGCMTETITVLRDLAEGRSTVWLAPRAVAKVAVTLDQVETARDRFTRFKPALAAVFEDEGWDGRIVSPLRPAPALAPAGERLFVKSDSELPVTGTIKARGGLHELLCWLEDVASAEGLLTADGTTVSLVGGPARAAFARRRIVVASTGNLGFSLGLFGRRFGASVQVHMSRDAKAWKKSRLIALGVEVVEHAADYSQTVARAREQATRAGAYFVDDESSLRLFLGYAPAAQELAEQLAAQNVEVGPDQPLVVYLPCGVGGAPGGVTAGLRLIYGDDVIPVFVEPVASACVLLALASGGRAREVYAGGMDNVTIADGLAVPKASQLVLDLVGPAVDGVVAVTDEEMAAWLRRARDVAGLRLEPSSAAAFAAVAPFVAARAAAGRPLPPRSTHIAWTTGGSRLPDPEFDAYLGLTAAV